MTEEQIERVVELKFDKLDARYLARELSEAEYRAAAIAIDKWADQQYRACPKPDSWYARPALGLNDSLGD